MVGPFAWKVNALEPLNVSLIVSDARVAGAALKFVSVMFRIVAFVLP
jgi:hypothetical protein